MNCKVFNRSCILVMRNLHISSIKNTAKPSPLIDSIIRVDHAGELGADRIYAGQMAVLGNTKMGPLIQHMWDQEKVHKATFENLIVKHRVRPTALVPVWNVAGFLLGASTALMGEKAAMACTVAVESVIVDHYNDQLRELMADPENNKELMQTIQKFRDEEQEHHDVGMDHGAEQAPFYRALSEIIKFGCKTAIAMSKELFSQRNQYNTGILSRSYSTSSNTNKANLYVSVCLERKPVILKPLSETEQKVFQLLLEMETENSFKSDHEIKGEKDLERTEQIKKDVKTMDLDFVLEQTAHEFEEISNKEFDGFQPSSLVTSDDKKNNIKSLNRKLSSHLCLLVKEKVEQEELWMFPFGLHKDSETLRETAERVLREKCGDDLNVVFLGNAPCGYMKWTFSKSQSKSSIDRVFFFKALYKSGKVKLQENLISDYQWADRQDLKKLFPTKKYFQTVSRFLIDDGDDFIVTKEKENLEQKKQLKEVVNT